MIYNLLKKEAANNWEVAKAKLIKSVSCCEERVDDDYSYAFPYELDDPLFKKEDHFIYEGSLLKPHRIDEDFSIYFYSERECIELGYRTLGVGEVLQGANIVYKPAPDNFHTWSGSEWTYVVDLERRSIERDIQSTERELETTQAQITSRKALGMFTGTLENKTNELLTKHSNLCMDLSLTYSEMIEGKLKCSKFSTTY